MITDIRFVAEFSSHQRKCNATVKYRRDLQKKDFEVTPEERATYMHILDRTIPVVKDLQDLLRQLHSHDAIDQEETQKLNEAVELLQGLLIPVALLKVVDNKQEIALSGMFSNMLKGRSSDQSRPDEPEAAEEPASGPKM